MPPPPAFDPPPVPPRFVVRALLGLHRAVLRLADAIAPPQLVLAMHATGAVRTHVVAAAARLHIADLLATQSRTSAELAELTHTDPDAMHRTMRALVALGVFVMDDQGRFANNRVSRGMLSSVYGNARAFAEYSGTRSNQLAWTDFDETLRTGKSAFGRVNGTSVWDWFASHPDEERGFADAMGALTDNDGPSIAAAYPFGELKTVCDIAGGRGTLLSHVLTRHTTLRAVLYDAPGVTTVATPFLTSRAVMDRVEILAGNFFVDVPSGCDAYVLKDILHDWDDERCTTILANVRRAAKPGTRILVCEQIVERDETDLFGALSDVQMMVVCDEGRQRGREDFGRLFTATGWALQRVVPTALPVSVVEGVAV